MLDSSLGADNLGAPVQHGPSDQALLAWNLTKALSNLSVRVLNAHLSKNGVRNLLTTESALLQAVGVLEQHADPTDKGLQVALGFFHNVENVVLREDLVLHNGGHHFGKDLQVEARAIATSFLDLDLTAFLPAP